MGEKTELTLDELLQSLRASNANPYDKKIIHTGTGLEFYIQCKSEYGDWFTLACVKEYNLKWRGHWEHDSMSDYFHLEKK